jgi:uncharacterized membrane protein
MLASRIAYLDWLRGVACLIMFQSHCYDAWLGGAARETEFFHWTRFSGIVPAPVFLFLAGIAVALVSSRMAERGDPPNKIASRTVLRGAQILGLGLLFRLQEFVLGLPGAPWTDLLRVDVLNIIGVSLMLLGVLYGAIALAMGEAARAGLKGKLGSRIAVASIAISAVIALVTPPLWTTYRPNWLPWYFESYINGVHIFNEPQAYLFPLFPWAAFAFAGLAAGCFLTSAWAHRRELQAVGVTAALGCVLIAAGLWFDTLPQVYAVYDFWHSSPNFFLIRLGLVMALMLIAYAWCRWGPGRWTFNPSIELGRQSLLVYWVHIQFAYGALSLLPKNAQNIQSATGGLIVLTLAMIALASFRNRTKGRPLRDWPFFWRPTVRASA